MAYHSKEETGVYHTCKNCTEGNNIERKNLAQGKPEGSNLCMRCKSLQQQGKCSPDLPFPAR